MNEDIRHLDLLAIFHFVLGAMHALCGCFPIIHLVIGVLMLTGAIKDNSGNGPPEAFGAMFVVFASLAILSMWAIAIAQCFAGFRLRQHRSYTFCMVVAAIECINMPFGTILGVLTLVVLLRPSVKSLFEAQASLLA